LPLYIGDSIYQREGKGLSNKVKLSPGKVIQFKKYIHGASDLGSRLRVRFSGSKKGLSYNNGNNTVLNYVPSHLET
jgi:hypothetical protein